MNPLSEILIEQGYGLISHPKENVSLLELRTFDTEGYLYSIGNISDLFEASASPIPSNSGDKLASRMSGGYNLKEEATADFSLLKKIFNNNSGLSTAFKDVKRVEYTFENLVTDDINHIQLDKFLSGAKVNQDSNTFSSLVEKGKIYVITSLLKSLTFSIDFYDENDNKVDVATPAIEEMLESKIGYKLNEKSCGKIDYQGDIPVVIAVKAVRVFYKGFLSFNKKIKIGAAKSDIKYRDVSGYLVETLISDSSTDYKIKIK